MLYVIQVCWQSWSCSQAVNKPVWHIPLLCVQWKTPDDRQRNCPKHVVFYSKSKLEKLVCLVGFNIGTQITVRVHHYLTLQLKNISYCLWNLNEPFANCQCYRTDSVLDTLGILLTVSLTYILNCACAACICCNTYLLHAAESFLRSELVCS